MPVPKRKHSKSRTRIKRNSHYKKRAIQLVKTKDGKAFKRPHIEERIE